ncbi:MAG: hypothetical protein IJV44_06230 [Prevotella sp.]|nr:hypothetical protein [Prevotella sp.]
MITIQFYRMPIFKRLFLCIAIAVSLCGCENRSTSSDLSKIDSLVSAEKYDSAYHEVLRINPQAFNSPEDKAHYNLLLTRTSMLTGHQYPSDSLIDFSISYYEKSNDIENLCEAYYYKAFYHEKRQDYAGVITLCKKAEKMAEQTKNKYLQYKIAEYIAYTNGICGNYDLELKNAKKALEYVLQTDKKNHIVLSYCRVLEAYQFLEKRDSALAYAEKAIEYLKYADKEDLPYLSNSIGFTYIEVNNEKAKYYLKKSLSYKPLARTFENLAWVYQLAGNDDKAYEYWKQALVADDVVPKENVLHNLLQHDLEHHNIEGACERLGDIVNIKDSLNKVLKDRSIQRIQQDFDEKVAQDRQETEKLRWTTIALALVVIILLLIGYIQYRRHKTKIKLAEHQMLITNYQSEINSLSNQRERAEQQIVGLNKKIDDLVRQESPRLYKGKVLFDHVMQNGTTVTWTKGDYEHFIDFYKAYDIVSYRRIMRKYSPVTPHNVFFLILYEMGKNDEDVRQIMGITQEGIRSTRHRINSNSKR